MLWKCVVQENSLQDSGICWKAFWDGNGIHFILTCIGVGCLLIALLSCCCFCCATNPTKKEKKVRCLAALSGSRVRVERGREEEMEMEEERERGRITEEMQFAASHQAGLARAAPRANHQPTVPLTSSSTPQLKNPTGPGPVHPGQRLRHRPPLRPVQLRHDGPRHQGRAPRLNHDGVT